MRKIRKFKTPTDFLVQLERDLTLWVSTWGADVDRLYSMGFDQMFELFGHSCRIGKENPRGALPRLQAEAQNAGNTPLERLLVECLRVLGSAYDQQELSQ